MNACSRVQRVLRAPTRTGAHPADEFDSDRAEASQPQLNRPLVALTTMLMTGSSCTEDHFDGPTSVAPATRECPRSLASGRASGASLIAYSMARPRCPGTPVAGHDTRCPRTGHISPRSRSGPGGATWGTSAWSDAGCFAGASSPREAISSGALRQERHGCSRPATWDSAPRRSDWSSGGWPSRRHTRRGGTPCGTPPRTQCSTQDVTG